MKPFSYRKLLLPAVFSFFLISCNEKEEFITEPLTDYVPSASGKYITYRLDSTVYTEFGTITEVHRYQEKHVVDSVYTDLVGNKTFRMYRWQRDSVGHDPWEPKGTYMLTFTPNQIELTENNLRFIKLHAPMREGFSWKGNKYIPYNPYDTMSFKFSNDDDMQNWNFMYDNFAPVFSYRGFNYNDVYTVEEVDEAFNAPVTIPSSYGSKSRAFEKYAKGIGMVFRHYEMWEYQPNPGNPRGPYRTGFGVVMWMIDHN